jgi:hypothetical protein
MINLLKLEMLEYVEAKLFSNGKPINSTILFKMRILSVQEK